MNSLATVALLTAAAALGGCSFSMTPAPSDPSLRTRTAAKACTADPLFPLMDTVSAGFGIYGTAVSVAAEEEVSLYGAHIDKEVGLGISLAQLGLFGAGAVYGYVQLARCDALRKQHGLKAPNGLTDPSLRAADINDSPGVDLRYGTYGVPDQAAGEAPTEKWDEPDETGGEDDADTEKWGEAQVPGEKADTALTPEERFQRRLPSWSAFKREPLAPLPDASPRTETASPPRRGR